MTPLDVCIQDEILDNLDLTQEIDGILSHREPETVNNVKKVQPLIIDESQSKELLNESTKEKKAIASAKMAKAITLMRNMLKYHRECSIKFLRQPHRLELKYEKSFTMAVKKNRLHLLSMFPRNSVKTVYVSMSSTKDIR